MCACGTYADCTAHGSADRSGGHRRPTVRLRSIVGRGRCPRADVRPCCGSSWYHELSTSAAEMLTTSSRHQRHQLRWSVCVNNYNNYMHIFCPVIRSKYSVANLVGSLSLVETTCIFRQYIRLPYVMLSWQNTLLVSFFCIMSLSNCSVICRKSAASGDKALHTP